MAVTINGTTGFTFPNGSEGTPSLTGLDSDTGLFFGTDEVSLTTAGTQKLIVDSDGKVGIGTDNPQGKLHTLAGSGGIPSNWLAGDFIFDGGSAKNDTELTLIGGVYTQVNSVNLNLLTAGNDYGNGLGQRIRVQKDSVGAGGNHSLYLDRVNTDGSGNKTITTLTRHSAAGDLFFDNASSKFIGQVENAVFIGNTALSASNYFVGMETRLGGDRDLILWSKTGDAGGNIIFKNGYTTNGSVNETVRIKSDGNVGIGTTNPTEKLTVSNNILLGASVSGGTATPSYINLGTNFSNGSTRDNLKIYLYNDGANEKYGFSVGSNGDIQHHSQGSHDFYINNSPVVKITTNGNVGIGTNNPDGLLHIQHTAQDTPFIVANRYNDTSSGSEFRPIFAVSELDPSGGTAGHTFIGNHNRAMHIGPVFGSDGTVSVSNSAISILNTGNVGIGTTNPTEKLHVNGSIKVENGIFGVTKVSGYSYTANTNLDITGFGYGNYLVNVRSSGVYHWNGVLMVTMFDTADFGVTTLVSGNYSTTHTAQMVNLSAGNGTLRLTFSRDFVVSVRVMQIG